MQACFFPMYVLHYYIYLRFKAVFQHITENFILVVEFLSLVFRLSLFYCPSNSSQLWRKTYGANVESSMGKGGRQDKNFCTFKKTFSSLPVGGFEKKIEFRFTGQAIASIK